MPQTDCDAKMTTPDDKHRCKCGAEMLGASSVLGGQTEVWVCPACKQEVKGKEMQ